MKYYWHILDLTSGEIVEHPFPYKSYRKALYAAKRFINYRVDRSLKRVCSIHITTNINFRFPDSELGWSPR